MFLIFQVQEKQNLIVATQNELTEVDERTRAMQEHLRNILQELQHTQVIQTYFKKPQEY